MRTLDAVFLKCKLLPREFYLKLQVAAFNAFSAAASKTFPASQEKVTSPERTAQPYLARGKLGKRN